MGIYANLYAISSGVVKERPPMTIDESVEWFQRNCVDPETLDEAYFGKGQVAQIQRAMDAIYAKVMADPKCMLNGSPEEKALEKAFCDLFGFGECDIYWSNPQGVGPSTYLASRIMGKAKASIRAGLSSGKFYDKDHQARLVIETSQLWFTKAGVTSAEMVGILLHEIGHNFDYSLWSIIEGWYFVVSAMLNALTTGGTSLVQLGIQTALQTTPGRKILRGVMNLGSLIADHVPPLRGLARGLGSLGTNIARFLQAVFAVPNIPALPMIVFFSPLYNAMTTLTRKKEVYSDSFAATYGYGNEIITGLEKYNMYMTHLTAGGPLTSILYDLAMAENELIAMCLGDHGSVQQRNIRMLDKLKRDLNTSGLKPKDKAEIQAEIKRLEETYNSLMSLDENSRNKITVALRTQIDKWYAGKNYMFVEPIDTNYAEPENPVF